MYTYIRARARASLYKATCGCLIIATHIVFSNLVVYFQIWLLFHHKHAKKQMTEVCRQTFFFLIYILWLIIATHIVFSNHGRMISKLIVVSLRARQKTNDRSTSPNFQKKSHIALAFRCSPRRNNKVSLFEKKTEYIDPIIWRQPSFRDAKQTKLKHHPTIANCLIRCSEYTASYCIHTK